LASPHRPRQETIVFVSVPANLGYPLLAAPVGGESAGLPIPGETALVSGAAVPLRSPVDQRGPFRRHRQPLRTRGERFFAAHGAKAVVLGRFVAGVRSGALVGALRLRRPG
jgi:membrane-associated protein